MIGGNSGFYGFYFGSEGSSKPIDDALMEVADELGHVKRKKQQILEEAIEKIKGDGSKESEIATDQSDEGEESKALNDSGVVTDKIDLIEIGSMVEEAFECYEDCNLEECFKLLDEAILILSDYPEEALIADKLQEAREKISQEAGIGGKPLKSERLNTKNKMPLRAVFRKLEKEGANAVSLLKEERIISTHI